MKNIRNIGIIAHIDAGKTTLTERLLFYTGKIYKLGNVDDGTATMDWMDQEKERGITITSATTSFKWKGVTINLIDTPGHVDFTVEVERSLKVLDGAIVVFDAVNGVEPQSETVWHQASKYELPRLVFINKMDREGADFFDCIKQIEKKLEVKTLPLQIPYEEGGKFSGVIDLLSEQLLVWENHAGKVYSRRKIPMNCREVMKEYRTLLLERVADTNDLIMEKILTDDEVQLLELNDAIREATISCKVFPVLCGSALKNKGVQPLLDAVVSYLPSPVESRLPVGKNLKKGNEEFVRPDPDSNFVGLVFKVQVDRYFGKLAYTRIYSGRIESGKSVLNVNKDRKERAIKLLRMHANMKQEIESASAGDVVAIVGLKSASTGDSLCDIKHPMLFSEWTYPEPVIWKKIDPSRKADEEKFMLALKQIEEEDPTFKVKRDRETGDIIISGMGELHLEVIRERLKREFGVSTLVGKPQVSYKETVTRESTGEGKFIKQIGERFHYGHVKIRIEPNERNKGFEFRYEVDENKVPLKFVPAIEIGLRDATEVGPVGGYPLVDIKVALIGGSYEEMHSSDFDFHMAAKLALKDALTKADPILLEPTMRLEIMTPNEYVGNVISDLNSRGGKVTKIDKRGKFSYILAEVKLREMFGYATVFRSLTRGKGFHMMEFLSYDVVPKKVLSQLLGVKI